MRAHVANYESLIAWHNSQTDSSKDKIKLDYYLIPHAVFTEPQIGSVGLTEKTAKEKGHKIRVGTSLFGDVAMGTIMGEPDSFVKVVIDDESKKI